MDGKTLSGRYILGRLIGRGGMGAVYEAQDVELKRHVAVKIMNPELSHSRSAAGRFEREARAASAIETEHLVRVLDAGVDEETRSPFMVMEYLRGEDLAQILHRLGPLPPKVALRIVAQACVGLQKAHEAGVLHRDVKPANLFLARREEGGGLIVKVLDFGIAKIKQAHDDRRDTTGLTRSGSMLGTPRYMSPEQARAIKDIDHRTDIWSLGVVLYHALAGRTPTDEVEAFGDLIAALVSDLPPPVQDLAPWVPPEVAAVVDGALQYLPLARYPSAAAMLEAIQPILGDDALSLDESMLVSLPPSERLLVAPKFEVRAVSRPLRRSSSSGEAPDRWREQTTDSATAPALETNEPPRASQQAPAPRRASKKLPLLVALLLALGLGGIVTLRPISSPSTAVTGMHVAFGDLPKAPSAESTAPPTTGVPQTAPPVESAAPARSTSTELPVPLRRVELEIIPRNASVQIDGSPAPLKDGKVALTGPLGTGHDVRVSSGKAELTERVFITEAGAHPPQIVLVPRRAASAGKKPRSAAAAPASAEAPAPAAAPSASSAPSAEPTTTSTSNPLMPHSFQ
ncbi:protein kinase [Sorangium cellulosum]|uniref:Protein kinase n=1 Tax=Sorangium cellulosum TaxID=56 RepID=A0A2L0FC76_SORCE|nr:serine/threonine-protein kinase [Sorangium cellulosum]AUX49154.1 protein kinase [Sorangium cellulosum]